MQSDTGWEPILSGVVAGQAEATIESLIGDIRDRVFQRKIAQSADHRPGLAGGYAGLAVTFAHLASGRADCEREARECLDRAVQVCNDNPVKYGVGFLTGIAGVAWAMVEVEAAIGRACVDGETSLCQTDAFLSKIMVSSPDWSTRYDIFEGLVGMGLYALERLPSLDATTVLDVILDQLSKSKRSDRTGTYWTRAGNSFGSSEGPRDSCIDLGIARGVPGIIGFLARCYAARVSRAIVAQLLEESIAWLLKQELSEGTPSSSFALMAGPRLEAIPAHTAWCYGDPGIASILMVAFHATGERAWKDASIRIATRLAKRPIPECRVFDAGICHGASGVAHMLNRLYQSTGDDVLRSSAQRWFRQVLSMRVEGRGVGGFLFEWAGQPYPTLGLLRGGAGVALTLAAAITAQPPSWDRAFLLSLRSEAT